MLSGQADAVDNVVPPLDNIQRIQSDTGLRVIPVPSPAVGFLLFNQQDPRNQARSLIPFSPTFGSGGPSPLGSIASS